MMGRLRGAVAHDVTQTERTGDVVLSESTTFSDLLLSKSTLIGLHAAGFQRPSPIQRSAIPLGRCGTDLIIHAKSGTGKTLVFGIIALEMLDISISQLQVLILAPTREIAVQIKEVLTSISCGFPGLQIGAFIGGLAVSDDVAAAKCCHVAVGTPGRVKQLVGDNSLRLRSVRLFVLDEADRLVEKSFRKDVNFIFSKLPENKQSLVASATFPQEMEDFLSKYLVHPRRVSPSADTLLLGLRQFVAVTRAHTSALVRVRNKTARLLQVLSSLSFRQCLVFCNLQSRMEGICRDLASRGWPALHLAGSMPQKERLAVVSALQNQRCRVLLTTDLAARGIDAEQVDLVVNLDLPYDTETYLHRIGRAGRFGAPGVAVSVVEDGAELTMLQHIFFDVSGPNMKVPLLPDGVLTSDMWENATALQTINSLERNEKKTSGDEETIHQTVSGVSDDEGIKQKVVSSSNGHTEKFEEEAIQLLCKQMLQVPKNITPVSFLQLTESYNSRDTSLPVPESYVPEKEDPLDKRQLEIALKRLRICGESEPEQDGEEQIIVNPIDSLSQKIDLEELSEYSYSEEEEDESTSESSVDSIDDYELVEENDCYICSSWFTEWRNQLSLQRQCLQNKLYLEEMLK